MPGCSQVDWPARDRHVDGEFRLASVWPTGPSGAVMGNRNFGTEDRKSGKSDVLTRWLLKESGAAAHALQNLRMFGAPYLSSLDYCGFEDGQFTLVAVEQGRNADGKSSVISNMTEGQAGHDWDFEREQPFFKHVFETLAVLRALAGFGIAAVLVHANSNGSYPLEQARVEQLRQHTVKAVGFLVEVFNEQNNTFQ